VEKSKGTSGNRQPSRKDGVLVKFMDPSRHLEAFEAERALLPGDDSDQIASVRHVEASVIATRRRTNTQWKPPPPRAKAHRRRLALPIIIGKDSGAVEVMACPDSGSDGNIISMELVRRLNLMLDTPDSQATSFSLANGKIVQAVGQVSTSCCFTSPSEQGSSVIDCVFHVFRSLAVPVIMGLEFLHATETLTKHRSRLVEQLIPSMQALRVNSIGAPKRSLECRLDDYIGFACADTGSDLDLVSSDFVRSSQGMFKLETSTEQVEFADGSIGYTSGLISTTFWAGIDFFKPGVPQDFHVLDNLTSNIIIGQHTLLSLDIFNPDTGSLASESPRPEEPGVNIIRHIGRLERVASKAVTRLREILGRTETKTEGMFCKDAKMVDVQIYLHLNLTRGGSQRSREEHSHQRTSDSRSAREPSSRTRTISHCSAIRPGQNKSPRRGRCSHHGV
jgi:hypothetical protein